MLAFLNRFQLFCMALCLGALTLLARPALADALIAQADLIDNNGNAIGIREMRRHARLKDRRTAPDRLAHGRAYHEFG